MEGQMERECSCKGKNSLMIMTQSQSFKNSLLLSTFEIKTPNAILDTTPMNQRFKIGSRFNSRLKQ
jgi:hypothetical protein